MLAWYQLHILITHLPVYGNNITQLYKRMTPVAAIQYMLYQFFEPSRFKECRRFLMLFPLCVYQLETFLQREALPLPDTTGLV